jgi:NhaP-type Na+/H+ or K+/H+ antiporter/mannitol/fructose-specific phosphotransferase system IIA component (Ntr-type)
MPPPAPALPAPADPHDMLLTIVAAISAGVFLIAIARRLGLPVIVLLLAGGILLGPAVMGESALVKPDALGGGLLVVVSLAVGLILFEGGLTLDVSGYRSASVMIRRLLTVGVVVTWLGTATAIRLIFDLPVGQAIVAASLVIVTGPTVIAPLLKRVKVNERLHHILHWEGVLIDPIGVFIAVMCFEWFSGTEGVEAVAMLGIRVAAGLGIGVPGGFAIGFLIRRKIVPEGMMNVFALGSAVLVFGLAEAVANEAGLLSVTAAGFIIGLTRTVSVKQIRQFKSELTDLLIGTLFILLAARLSFEQFADFGLRGAAVVLIVMLVIRPLSIFLCAWRLDLPLRERAFLGWIAPRGVVAASIASLFAINMESAGVENAKFVETFTYSVIVSTIVLQGLTAGPLARLLKVMRPEPRGWLIVGAHAFARRIAAFISETAKLPAVLVDTNGRAVRDAEAEGLVALTADARETALQDRPVMQGIGNVLALTDNEDLNVRICQHWSDVVGSDHVFRCNPTGIMPAENDSESEQDATPGRVVWPRLPRPSLVAGELMRRETTILETGAASSLSHFATPVAWFADGRVSVTGLDEKAATEDGSARTLYVRREADYLMRAVRPALIGPVDAEDLRSLLERLVDRIVEEVPKLPRDATLEELLERETVFPTALGAGVAAPHAFSNAIDERICAIAQVRGGVDFRASDGEPVRLVFLLLSPQGDPEGHLATLAEIARVVLDEHLRQRLMDAGSPQEIMGIIGDAERVR